MKKRKLTALMLTAAMVVTGTGGTTVFASDVEDVEVFEAGQETEEVVQFTEDEAVAAVQEEEALQAEGEQENLFSSGVQEEAFGDGQTEVFADEEDGEITSEYNAVYVSMAEFEQWAETGEVAEDKEWFSLETEGSLNDLLGLYPEKNTGFCIVSVETEETGYEDLVVPAGMNLGFCNCPVSLQSITANGNVMFKSGVNTPGNLEIKEGNGKIVFSDGEVRGTIIGSGSNDTVVFQGEWNRIGGLQGVENTVFLTNSLEITGSTEFYNIQNLCQEDRNLYFNIEGYGEDKIPVFHMPFDFGMRMDTDENGNLIEGPAGIGVHYFETFDTEEDWKTINIGNGNPAVRFDMQNDSAILSVLERMWIGVDDMGYGIDIDGSMFNGENGVGINQLVDTSQMTAQEAYERYGRDEFPGENWGAGMGTGSIENVMRIINAYQQNGGSGYYIIDIPSGYDVQETLTVPDSVAQIKYNLGIGEEETSSAKVSSVFVPEGKTLSLCSDIAQGGTLDIQGNGTTEFLNCRLNQEVKVEGKAEVFNSVVRSLVCDTFLSEMEYSRIVIGEYLKFNQAVLNTPCIYAVPGAKIEFGSVDNTGIETNDLINVFLGVNGSQKAQIVFNGKLDLGTDYFVDEDGQKIEFVKAMNVFQCDTAAAAAAGASFTEDCYNAKYEFDWRDEAYYFENFLVPYTDEEECIATITSQAVDAGLNYECINYLFGPAEGKEMITGLFMRAIRPDFFTPADDGIDGNKYATGYYDFATETYAKSPKYYLVGVDAQTSIEDASVSSIKNQTYTGKALTPAVTVKLDGKTLEAGTDYTVAYKNNVKVGTATVTITGTGSYTGTLTTTFKIVQPVPKKLSQYSIKGLKYIVTKSSATSGTVSVMGATKKTYTAIIIPDTVKINGYTFKVDKIASDAFKNYTKLKKIMLGSNITYIGSNTFYGCKNLSWIVVNGTKLNTVKTNALKGIKSNTVISVPASKVSAYKKLFTGKGCNTIKVTKK